MNREEAIKFLKEQIQGIENAITEDLNRNNSIEQLRDRQDKFNAIVNLLEELN